MGKTKSLASSADAVNFDRDIDLAGLGGSARRYQPSCHLGEAFAAVLEKFFTDFPPGVISQEYAVAPATPVDATQGSDLITNSLP
jgi:hypothetical protein